MTSYPYIVKTDNNRCWYLDKNRAILHREDGPAVEWDDGSKSWYIYGKRHRLDGPAVEYATGYKAWYINDKLHRLDGPAIEWEYKLKDWCINDVNLTNDVEDWMTKNSISYPFDEETSMLFKLTWG